MIHPAAEMSVRIIIIINLIILIIIAKSHCSLCCFINIGGVTVVDSVFALLYYFYYEWSDGIIILVYGININNSIMLMLLL